MGDHLEAKAREWLSARPWRTAAADTSDLTSLLRDLQRDTALESVRFMQPQIDSAIARAEAAEARAMDALNTLKRIAGGSLGAYPEQAAIVKEARAAVERMDK